MDLIYLGSVHQKICEPMKKDFAKNKFAALSGLLSKKHWFELTCAATVLIGSAAYFIFHYQAQSLTSFAIAAVYKTIRNDHHEPSTLEKERIRLKQALRANADPVQFEFYASLPNMRVEAAPPPSEKVKVLAPTTTKAPVSVASAAQPKLFSEAALEKDLANQLKQKHYIIQLGLFNHLASAEKFRDAMLPMGMQVTIAKIKAKQKENYRVQIGPFASMQQTQVIQQKLERQGIHFLVRHLKQS